MDMAIFGCVLFLFSCLGLSHQKHATQAIRITPSVLLPSNGQTCPQVNDTAHRGTLHGAIQDYYNSQGPQCSCGATGNWTRAVFLDMSDPTQQCPSSWTLVTSPVRGCGRTTTNFGECDSATFTVGSTYSKVCGKVQAIQKGQAAAFYNIFRRNIPSNLDNAYLDGVSLTHGVVGSRQHIWSFVGADPVYRIEKTCPCTNTTVSWSQQVPSYINSNYFCDTGNPGPGTSDTNYYIDDPLWDGQGCDSTSSCCEFNNPPWFCTTLPQATSDDLELRNCYTDGSSLEDKIITLIDIYVM